MRYIQNHIQLNGANAMAGLQQQGLPAREGRIKGIFSTQKVVKIGTGVTTRKTIQQAYYYISEDDEGNLEMQPLNRNYIPAGKKSALTKDELLRRFTPEPEFYVTTVQPRMQEMDKAVESGDAHRDESELYSAQFEYGRAMELDEENVRANFGIGLCYLERGDNAKAEDILQRIVKLEAAFSPEHKHLFNEFGISLRKAGMHDQAVSYYGRALEMAEYDDHLHYNVARTFVEKGDLESAMEHLKKCLELNPELEPAQKLMEGVSSQMVQ